MRSELLYNPRLLCERLAELSIERRRRGRLRGTPAAGLRTGQIDSLELLDLLREQPPQVIYDVGANIGTWSLLARTMFPLAEIHAFEPLPAHATRYRANMGGIRGVHLHEVALGNEQGTRELRVVDISDASSVLPLAPAGQNQWHVSETEIQPVTMERLDAWVRAKGIPPPDLLKLDVQGFELEVLRGGTEVLRHARAVLTEVSFQEFYHGQCLFHDLVTYLAGFDYHVQAFGHGMAIGRRLVQADVLFIQSAG